MMNPVKTSPVPMEIVEAEAASSSSSSSSTVKRDEKHSAAKRRRPRISSSSSADPRAKKCARGLLSGASVPPARRSKRLRAVQMEVEADTDTTGSKITGTMLRRFRDGVDLEPPNRLAMLALGRNSVHSLIKGREHEMTLPSTFTHTVGIKPPPTDQKSSGRCWLFASLNTIRIPTIKEHDLKHSFEFSQSYLFFYDKLEKANVYLSKIIDYREMDVTTPEMRSLMGSPIYDGGGWTMFKNLIKKYGIVPKSVMPDNFQAENSALLNKAICDKLRIHTVILREMSAKGATVEELQAKKAELLEDVYRMLVLGLGQPPTEFDWRYETKKGKKTVVVENLTPMDFFLDYVPFNLDDMVLVINMPHTKTPFHARYASLDSNNTVEGDPEVYLNLPYREIIPAAIRSIKDGTAVYFSCDVKKQLDSTGGKMDLNLFDYEALFDTSFEMSKRDRVMTRQSRSTHAMVLTGVNLKDGSPNRWRIENSWGKHGDGGYITMSQEWFENFTYKFLIHKDYLPPRLREMAEQEPVEMGMYDPI